MAEAYDPPRPWSGDIAAPLTLFETKVRPEWIDEFGHVNVAHYVTICDHATWAFWNWINAPEGTQEARGGHEYAVVESHQRYLGELALGDPITVTTQLLGVDDKRYVLFHSVIHHESGALAATNEVKVLGFDLGARRAEAFRAKIQNRLAEIGTAHGGLPSPDGAGLGIAIRPRSG